MPDPRVRFHTYATLLLFAVILPLAAQTPAQDLSDPQALLASARAGNGLSGEDLRPWHLKADYELFDDNGKPLGNGVFEEWWLAKDKWKQRYSGDHYTGTLYHSPEGYARQGEQLPWPELLIAVPLVTPMQEQSITALTVSPVTNHKEMTPSLPCIDVSFPKGAATYGYGPYRYCFDPGTATLRFSQDQYFSTVYPLLGKFQGHKVGMKTEIKVNGKTIVKVHVTTLQTESVVEASIAPTEGPTEPVVVRRGQIEPPKLIRSEDPIYPQTVGGPRREATVVVRMVVNTAGRATDIHTLASPDPSFAQSAITAIRGYRFEPALLAGQPVATETIIMVSFKVHQ